MSLEPSGTRAASRLDPLGRRLLLAVILVSSAVTLVLTALQMHRDYSEDVDRIEASFELIESSYLPTLVNSLWHVDNTQTRILLDGMASLPDIDSIRVDTPEGAIHEKTIGESRRTLARRYDLVHAEGRRVGELTIVASIDVIIDRLIDKVLFILVGNAFKTFLVAGFALVLFHFMVTRHLQRIATYASSPDAGLSSRSPLTLERKRKSEAAPDSLSVLESSLNDMWRRLADEGDRLKDSERRLLEYKDQLEKLVAERTNALQDAQQELLRAERLATIGQLTATVSHELRNPLGTLMTSVQTLRSDLSAPSQRSQRVLERIDRSVLRCTSIIDELLDFVQMREIDPQPVLLDGWIEQVVDDFDFPDAVHWTWRGDAQCTVRIDPRRMEQCLSNVLHNACQCMLEAEGSGHVDVATRVARGRAEILVSDSGPGVAPELRERIFEPLFSTRGFGVGLGLPLVLRIMQQHGGGVEVDDSERGGARFVLWLPLTEDGPSGAILGR